MKKVVRLKPVEELVCPKCGANAPIIVIDIPKYCIPYSLNEEKGYDLAIFHDVADEEDPETELLLSGEAVCYCHKCKTLIQYYYDEEDGENETKCNRSSE